MNYELNAKLLRWKLRVECGHVVTAHPLIVTKMLVRKGDRIVREISHVRENPVGQIK